MVILAVFAVGLFGGSLGVFSFLLLEAVVCCVAFADGWSAGPAEAALNALKMAGALTTGFVVALVVSCLASKFKTDADTDADADFKDADLGPDATPMDADRRMSWRRRSTQDDDTIGPQRRDYERA